MPASATSGTTTKVCSREWRVDVERDVEWIRLNLQADSGVTREIQSQYRQTGNWNGPVDCPGPVVGALRSLCPSADAASAGGTRAIERRQLLKKPVQVPLAELFAEQLD